MVHRIAVASTDGENIDLHFAKAFQFYIFDVVDEQEYTFVEVRENPKALRHGEIEFQKIIATLQDCSAIVVSQIGYGAAKYIFSTGIRVFEAPYPISAVLHKFAAKQILSQVAD